MAEIEKEKAFNVLCDIRVRTAFFAVGPLDRNTPGERRHSPTLSQATARPWGLKLEVGSRVWIGITAECWWLHLVDVHSIYQRSWDPAQQKWRWHSAVQRWAQWQMCALAQQTPEGMAASMATLSSRNTMSAVSVNHRDDFPFSRSHIWKDETNNNEKPS